MKKKIYLSLAAVNAIVTYIPLTYFILSGDYSLPTIITTLTGNALIVFLLLDLLLSCVVFWIFIYWEHKQLSIRYWWVAIVLNLTIGLCVAIPFFLYLRERALEHAAGAALPVGEKREIV